MGATGSSARGVRTCPPRTIELVNFESSETMTYEAALDALDGLEGRGWRLGLDRMAALVDRAGLKDAIRERGYVHIAGTNGKGTVTALTESILRHQGWRTGAFYSPYVVDYRERIQAEGRLIAKDDLAKLVAELLPVGDSLADTAFGGATKFELEAAIGFAYWQRKACDWVALEVGLGGRYDATNVVHPKASVIVSIGLDHTSILGETLAEIAGEKAGIIKPGIPVVAGDLPTEAMAVVEAAASANGAPLFRFGREFDVEESSEGITVRLPDRTISGLRPKLTGSKIGHNVAVASMACAVGGALRSDEALAEGIATAWLPGRYDRRTVRGRQVIFDGAHNEAAARALLDGLPPGPLHLVTNMVAGHEVRAFYELFRGRAVAAEVAPIGSPRALSVDAAVEEIQALGIAARGHESVEKALEAALGDPGAQILVTGSNYLVGDALRLHPTED